MLAPGYKAADVEIKPAEDAVTANFTLAAEPWKNILVHLKDHKGAPVVGEEITCSIGRIVWARYKTDSTGCSRIEEAPDVGMTLAINPSGSCSVEPYLSGTKDDPSSITLPILPPIRGCVVDTAGRPVANVAVGRWMAFAEDGIGEMLAFSDGASALSDRDGNFAIAPRLEFRYDTSQPASERQFLCFAEPAYREKSWLH